MAARSAASVSSGYSALPSVSNPFVQVNLTPHTAEGVTSYDNAETVEALSKVYHYSQQDASYLMPLLSNVNSIDSLFVKKNLFNKLQLVQKTEESPNTPLTVPTSGTRAYAPIIWHQGLQIDRDVKGRREYAVTAHAQMELAYAIARATDIGIVQALTSSVLSLSSASSESFKGVKTASTVTFPNSQIYANATGSGSTVTFNDLSAAVFDDISLLFEDKSINVADLVVIGGPKLRRKLKAIQDFRDNEKTIAYGASENMRMIEWLDLKFVFLGPETVPPKSLVNGKKVGSKAGIIPAAQSGSAAISASSDSYFTFIVADLSCVEWGDLTSAKEMLMSERDDISYTNQLYVKVGFGGMRLDDSKVLVVATKD